MLIKNRLIRDLINSVCELFGKHWIAFPRIPTDNKILFFSRDQVDFGFLSNFYLCDLHIDQMKTHPGQNSSEIAVLVTGVYLKNPGFANIQKIYDRTGHKLK